MPGCPSCRRGGPSGRARVSAELPESGERLEGLLPPVAAAPTFAIRKPAVAVFTLDDYVTTGIMTDEQAESLRGRRIARKHPRRRQHVHWKDHAHQRPAGRSGKERRSRRHDRGYTRAAMRGPQPHCHAQRGWRGDALRSRPVFAAPATRPYSEALDLLKACGTGHPGGIGTIHAGTGIGALRRLESSFRKAAMSRPLPAYCCCLASTQSDWRPYSRGK